MDYFQMLEQGLTSLQLLVADPPKQYCDYMQRDVRGTFDLCDKLIQANNVQDSMDQSEFVQARDALVVIKPRASGNPP